MPVFRTSTTSDSLPEESALTRRRIATGPISSASYLTVIAGRRLLLDQELRFGEATLVERIATALELAP